MNLRVIVTCRRSQIVRLIKGGLWHHYQDINCVLFERPKITIKSENFHEQRKSANPFIISITAKNRGGGKGEHAG